MRKRTKLQYLRMATAISLTTLSFTPPVHQLAASPAEIQVPLGQQTVVPLSLPFHAVASSSDKSIAYAASAKAQGHRYQDLTVISHDLGDTVVSTRLFGIFPWKSIRVHVVPQNQVFVGGQSVGIRLRSNGVIVIGYQRVDGSSPAAAARIRVGDVVEEINQHKVTSANDVRRWVNSMAKPLNIKIRRGTIHELVQVNPIEDSKGQWHLGLFVREKTSGVGTLTFYDANHHQFGALGHVITDVDTGQEIEGTGSLYAAAVTSVVKGSAGKPGEKRGKFIDTNRQIGAIVENSPFGVFGNMTALPRHLFLSKEVPVALPEQVHAGPAQLLTVIHGEKIESFNVMIENVVKQTKPTTKSMVIRVVDRRLLAETGGIIQGMSGSPLIQNGKLIGAVTHVFVSDPTRGYGVYAQWMLKESERPAKATHQNVQTSRGIAVTRMG
jgi:stage IV sporulation protein B